MKVLIVDDHPLVRAGVKSILSLENNIEVINEAKNVEEALTLIRKNLPEIVLVDLRLGDRNGLEIVRKSKENRISSKFIVLTSSVKQSDFLKAEKFKIDGYVLKEALPDELIYAIRIVNNGRKYYDPVLLEYKMQKNNEFVEELTARENEVLEALGKGLNNRQIAEELCITLHTVKKHVSQVLAKLDLDDRTQAALYANKMGLVSFNVN